MVGSSRKCCSTLRVMNYSFAASHWEAKGIIKKCTVSKANNMFLSCHILLQGK